MAKARGTPGEQAVLKAMPLVPDITPVPLRQISATRINGHARTASPPPRRARNRWSVNGSRVALALVQQAADEKPYDFYPKSSDAMSEVPDNTVALTVTSPPYWNSIDYDLHANGNGNEWYRERAYQAYGTSYPDYLDRIERTFTEVRRTTIPGGFCAIVIGTILQNGDHYPAPMDITARLTASGWQFHQDIVWNKVTGGVKRAGSYIQRPRAGYFYPNIMTEYILIFRKPGPKRYDSELALPIDDVFTRDIANTVWHIAPVPPNQIDHPCPFPDELVRRLVMLYSHHGDTVLDPFLGSGQTARVAVQNGRKAIGYEIEPAYIEFAKSRMEDRSTRKFQLIPKVEKVRVENGV